MRTLQQANWLAYNQQKLPWQIGKKTNAQRMISLRKSSRSSCSHLSLYKFRQF